MEEDIKKKTIDPEDVFKEFLKWFNSDRKLAFFVALIVGLIAHMQMITGTLMSQDGLWNSMEYAKPGDWEIRLGRWGIYFVENLTNFIAIPSISTILSLVLIAITSIVLIDIFKFKNKLSIVFTSLFLVLAPTFVATMAYAYTAPAYIAAVLFACLSIWIIKNVKGLLKFIFSSVLIMLSLSIYQSVIGVILGLSIIVTVVELIKAEKSLGETITDLVNIVIATVVGFTLYIIITLIILKILNLEFANRSGGVLAIFDRLIIDIKNCYKDFLAYFLRDRIIINTSYYRNVLFILLFVITSILYIIRLIKMKNDYSKLARIILSLLFIFLLPIGLNIVNIMVPGNVIYSLTAYQMVLMFLLIFGILECINIEEFSKYKRLITLLKWMTIILLFIIVVTYFWATLTSYTALQLTYNQAYSTTERIIDRIETTDGYEKGMPVLIGGMIGNDNYPRTSSLYGFTIGDIINNPIFHISYGGQVGTWQAFIKIFFGLDINLCDEVTYARILNSVEYENMDLFPNSDSVKIIDNVVVVKLRDEKILP